nr:hypothetical protein [Vampirovibrio sp.]
MVDIQLLKQQLLTNPYKNATSYHVYQNKISANTLDALDKQNVYEKFRDNRTEIFELARESVDNGLTGSDLVSAIKSSDVYEDLALTLPEEAFFFENLANVYDEGYISEVYDEGPDVPTPLDLM